MKQKLIIVKIGGNVLDNPAQLTQVLKAFHSIKDFKILVHGGGKKASDVLNKLGIEPRMADGRRITDAETLEVIQMVYAGLINKNIVTELQALSCNAIGLSGADANTITAKKRPVKTIDYGFAGDIKSINFEMITNLLNLKLTPVFCSVMHDSKGQILNTNADTVAAKLAAAMSKNFEVELLYCFEKNGVLQNSENEDSVIKQITPASFEVLTNQKIIGNGMIPKIHNALFAVQNGVRSCRIMNSVKLNEYTAGKLTGTEIALS
jgi:acetylglutamate kinase